MTCREVIDFLTSYLEGTLPAQERIRFEEHLRDCPDCVGYLETYEATVKLGKDAYDRDDGAAPEISDALVRAILAVRLEQTRR